MTTPEIPDPSEGSAEAPPLRMLRDEDAAGPGPENPLAAFQALAREIEEMQAEEAAKEAEAERVKAEDNAALMATCEKQRAIAASPDKARSASMHAQISTGAILLMMPSGDGRLRTPNPCGWTGTQLEDAATVLDAELVGRLRRRKPGPQDSDAAMARLRYEAAVAEYADASPLEKELWSALLLSREHHRRLLSLAGASTEVRSSQRWSGLANRAADDIRKATLALHELRRGHRGAPGTQVNVAENLQVVNGAEVPA